MLAAGQIAHALKRHRAKVTVFVPHYAMSGGTLIALAADEIVMDPNAVLGPVDPQLGQSPAASVLTVLERRSRKTSTIRRSSSPTSPQGDHPGSAAGAGSAVRTDVAESAAALADKLATGTWTHDYPIMAEEGKALGLPVSTEMPEDIYEFMNLFPQPTRTQPSVEYVPMPYRGAGPHRSSTGS